MDYLTGRSHQPNDGLSAPTDGLSVGRDPSVLVTQKEHVEKVRQTLFASLHALHSLQYCTTLIFVDQPGPLLSILQIKLAF
jgi:hypothetical protein